MLDWNSNFIQFFIQISAFEWNLNSNSKYRTRLPIITLKNHTDNYKNQVQKKTVILEKKSAVMEFYFILLSRIILLHKENSALFEKPIYLIQNKSYKI